MSAIVIDIKINGKFESEEGILDQGVAKVMASVKNNKI
jgi:hypothetical protein